MSKNCDWMEFTLLDQKVVNMETNKFDSHRIQFGSTIPTN